jgi:hypothetical protein
MRSNPLVSLFSISAIVVACGGGDGDSLTPRATVDQTLDLLCKQGHACRAEFPADAPFAFVDVFENTEAECNASLDMLSLADEIQASVDAGRVDFDAGDADACLAFQEGLSCADLWGNFFQEMPPTPAVCDTTFVGTVPIGSACTIDLDCAGDALCNDALVCEAGA